MHERRATVSGLQPEDLRPDSGPSFSIDAGKLQTLCRDCRVASRSVLCSFCSHSRGCALAGSAGVQADCGIKVTFRESYAVAWSHAGRYALLLLLIYLICFFPALVIELIMLAGIGFTALHKAQTNPLMIVMFPILSVLQMAALIVGLIVGLRFALAFPASVIENLTAWQAIKRSGALTRGAKGRIFLILLV